jgi:hypothetical protein
MTRGSDNQPRLRFTSSYLQDALGPHPGQRDYD